MTTSTKQKRKFARVIGVLAPERLYTSEGALRYGGLGTNSLRAARLSGVVKPLERGNRVYYRGSELIAWITGDSKDV